MKNDGVRWLLWADTHRMPAMSAPNMIDIWRGFTEGESMKIFVDTSALYSLLDRNDSNHQAAGALWRQIVVGEQELITTNYVLVETFALVQNRLGMAAFNDLQSAVTPLLVIEWVDSELHQIGVVAVLTAGRRQVSLVDCISFAACRRLGISSIFAFDSHFWEQGFLPVTDEP